MSRHSHWAKIKRGKGSSDVQRGKLFSKLARLMTVAAREGGLDPAFNVRLRLIIERAKADAMPKDAIERACVRGGGVGGDAIIETVLYEVFGPGGVVILVECLTDNRNRALGEVKGVCIKQHGNLGGEGSIRWQFDRRGVVEISGTLADDAELALIEAGADDIRREADRVVVLTAVEDLQKAREAAVAAGLTITDAELAWIPKQPVDVPDADREPLEHLLAAFDDCDDVQEVYTNARGY